MPDAVPSVQIFRSKPEIDAIVEVGFSVRAEAGLSFLKLQSLKSPEPGPFKEAVGVTPPPALSETCAGNVSCSWLAPREWLITCPENEARRVLQAFGQFKGSPDLIVDATDALVTLIVEGNASRDALASQCPLDLSEKTFPVQAVMRSLFGTALMTISRRPDVRGQGCFRLVVDQTDVKYVMRMLREYSRRAELLS